MSKNPIETLQTINQSDHAADKEHIQETSLSVVNMHIDQQSTTMPSIKIDEATAKKAARALRLFVKANENYTKNRIDHINECYKMYDGGTYDPDAEDLTSFQQCRAIVDDIIQELYLTFSNLGDTVEVEDDSNTVSQYIQKSLTIDDTEGGRRESIFRSIINGINNLRVNSPEDEPGKNILQEFLGGFFGASTAKQDVYHFRKAEIVKGFIKSAYKKSGLEDIGSDGQDNLYKLMENGVKSGMFCIKEYWGADEQYKLVKAEKTDDLDDTPTYAYELDRQESYKLIPVDTRNLIFSKVSTEQVVEKIENVPFSEIMNATFDFEGNPKQFPLYDPDMVMKAREMLLEEVVKSEAEDKKDGEEEEDNDYYDDDERVFNARVTIYQGYQLPLTFGKKVFKSMITAIKFGDMYHPIQVKENRYFECNFKCLTMFTKDGDVAGKSIIHILKDLLEALDTLFQFSQDILMMSLWGITAVDENSIVNPEALTRLDPKTPVRLKNTNGRNIKDIISWYTPPLEILSFVEPTFNRILNQIDQLSGRGAPATKVQPNPTATEASSLIQERRKPIQQVSIRLNNLFQRVMHNMYVYYMLNREEHIKIRALAKRVISPKDKQAFGDILSDGAFEEIEKALEVSVDDVFIDGVQFTVSAFENFERQAVQKQQFMQLVNMLMPLQGQPFTDETGSTVELDVYGLITKLAMQFDETEIWKPVQQQPSPSPDSGLNPSPQAGAGTSPDQLSTTPGRGGASSADVLNQVTL